MSTQTPTTAELTAQIVGAIEAQIGQTASFLPKSFIRVLAKVLSAVFITLYKYIGFASLQLFVSTASGSPTVINGKTVTPLTLWGRLIGLGDPIAATSAELTITVTVESQTGTLASGAQLLGDVNGVTYTTQGAVLLNAPTVSVSVLAVADPNGTGGVGELGNLTAGDTLTFANPLPNVSRAAVVVEQTVTGADAETTEEYRERVVERFQRRPQGGAYADYAIWGEAVAGVANIYPYTGAPGQVDIYVESSTETDGIPTTAQLNAVDSAVQFASNGLADRRPANAWTNIYPITRTGFAVTVSGLIADDLATVMADIQSALEDYFTNASPYIVGLDVPPRMDALSAVEVAGTINDITRAAGASFTGSSFRLDGTSSPLSAYSLGEGEKAKLSSVGFL